MRYHTDYYCPLALLSAPHLFSRFFIALSRSYSIVIREEAGICKRFVNSWENLLANVNHDTPKGLRPPRGNIDKKELIWYCPYREENVYCSIS
jgi:hypothetical protein